MIRFIRKGTLTAALLGFGFVPASFAGSPYAVNRPNTVETPAKDEQVVIVREPGKPDRHCVLVAVKENPDGSKTYQVKASDNGEIISINQRLPEPEKSPVIGSLSVVKPVEAVAPVEIPKPIDAKPVGIEPIDAPAVIDPKVAVPEIALPVIEPIAPEMKLPRLKDRPVDPLLNPPTVEMIKVPNMTRPKAIPTNGEKKPRKGLLEAIFGRNPFDPEETCGVCNTVCPPASQQAPEIVASKPIPEPVLTPPPAPEPVVPAKGIARIEPVGRSTIDDVATVAAVPPQPPVTRPLADPLPITVPAHNSGTRQLDPESKRFEELKKELVTALRPSQRMAAAEDLIVLAPGRLEEVRAALMTAAQEDAAGCVRAACVHCLAKLRTRDQAYLSLLDSAQEDEDAEVRQVAAYALQKATMNKR